MKNLNKEDINERRLPKNTTGVVVTKILEGTPLMFISVNDVIVELQKKKITNMVIQTYQKNIITNSMQKLVI